MQSLQFGDFNICEGTFFVAPYCTLCKITHMPPKLIKLTPSGEVIKEVRSKSPPKPYIESEVMKLYRLERDICWYIQNGGECECTEEQIEEVRNKYFNNHQTQLF